MSTTKQIQMSLSEYNDDLEKAEVKGMQYAISVIKDILDNDGRNVRINEKTSKSTLDFINYLKEINERIKRTNVTEGP